VSKWIKSCLAKSSNAAGTPRLGKSRGHIGAADFEAVRAAGYTDAQVIDIVAELAFSFVTNLFNNTFKTDIDSALPCPKQSETHISAHP